ncbi:MAG: DUF1015 domain-containing protein [Candidatus Omnitrophica bacterium]|nr:DUF1015 domain-containing protein [Candidatus Omnitrophota bacterium]
MAKVKPFRAVTYNQEKAADLSGVVCPPYDVISPARQQYYHSLSPYNFLHILLAKDIPGEDKYRRAENYFKDWLKNKILVQEKSPAIYFYSQEYKVRGEKKTRFGFIGLLHLQDDNSSVFRHEHTRLEPKEDRLRLLKAVKANLSPIFVLCDDKKRVISGLHQKHIQGKDPFINLTDDEKVVHKLWRIDSGDILEKIQANMQDEDIFIADGHHRYEVACAYRDEMKKKLGRITGEEDFNYILTYFTNIDSRGLTILPIHRLVRLNAELDEESFLAGLRDYFDIDEIEDKTRFFFLMEKAGFAEHVLGMYKNKKYRLLRLKNVKILDKLIADKPKAYRSLDVCILNYLILKNILGFDTLSAETKQNITFTPHADELIEKVDGEAGYIAFFLNPVKVRQIMSVAMLGERMPPKSTYFYPKVLSGLVVNKHE